MPSPRKWRIIMERDNFGRIVHSVPPPVEFASPPKPFYGVS